MCRHRGNSARAMKLRRLGPERIGAAAYALVDSEGLAALSASAPGGDSWAAKPCPSTTMSTTWRPSSISSSMKASCPSFRATFSDVALRGACCSNPDDYLEFAEGAYRMFSPVVATRRCRRRERLRSQRPVMPAPCSAMGLSRSALLLRRARILVRLSQRRRPRARAPGISRRAIAGQAATVKEGPGGGSRRQPFAATSTTDRRWSATVAHIMRPVAGAWPIGAGAPSRPTSGAFHPGPFAAGEADRVEEHAAHGRADLPAHLGIDRPDAGHVQRDIAADLHRRAAFGHEAAGRDVADLHVDPVPALRRACWCALLPTFTRPARRGLKAGMRTDPRPAGWNAGHARRLTCQR